MQTKRLSPAEVLVAFDDFDDRERFFVRGKFRHQPGEGYYARWVADDNGSDTTRWVELTAPPNDRDNLRTLAMKVRVIRKQDPLMIQGYKDAQAGQWKPPLDDAKRWVYEQGFNSYLGAKHAMVQRQPLPLPGD